jgi:large repetitive protein
MFVLLPAQASHSAPVANTALINGDSVTTVDGITQGGTAISLEQYAAQKAGFTVTVVTGAQWDAMTAADFAKYQLLVVGDPDCGPTPASATSNVSTWAPVVMGTSVNTTVGNRTLIGTDPEYHYGNQNGISGGAPPTNPADPQTAGAEHLVQDGMAFAGAVAGATGVYFDTSCADSGSDIAALNSLSVQGTGFSEDTSPPCGGSVQLIASNPAFSTSPTTLTDANIQGWNCSDHITFPTYPADFEPLAVATDTATHPTCGTDPSTGSSACGEAYVFVSGAVVATSPDLALTPPTATDPVGGTHTVTATVTDGTSGPPISGVTVTFLVTGQNSGVSGTCAPVSCVTNSSGQVTFTYPDTKGAGTDTIDASITVGGTLFHATATKVWSSRSCPPVVRHVFKIGNPKLEIVRVLIVGNCLSGATNVLFGSVADPPGSFAVTSHHFILASPPQQAAGAVDVTVTTPGGTSAINSPADQYTYYLPRIDQVAPDAGPTAGGNTVLIRGFGFSGIPAPTVSFGAGNFSSVVTVLSDGTLHALVPPHAKGTVDVQVTTFAGISLTFPADQYKYK